MEGNVQGRRFRVVSGELQHETNTFNRTPTTLSNFEDEYYIVGYNEILRGRRGTRSGIGGVIEAAETLYNWNLGMNLVASANPTGTITSQCFEEAVAALLKPLQDSGKVDGVLLCLHGAMVSEGYPDAEGEILRRAREIVGPNVPIIATLDLHGNVTAQMTETSNCLIACRTYPHVDFYEMSIKAAGILQQAMNGQVLPRSVIAKRSMTHGLDRGRTFPGSPMQTLIDRSEGFELTDRAILCVSVCAGFPAADFYDVGPSTTVTVDLLCSSSVPGSKSEADGETADSGLSAGSGADAEADVEAKRSEILSRGQAIAEEFMDFCWEHRDYSSVELLSVSSAVQLAAEFQEAAAEAAAAAALATTDSERHQSQALRRQEGIADTIGTGKATGSATGIESSSSSSSSSREGKGNALILAEITDNPGSGHYGDATNLLVALIRALRPPYKLHTLCFYSIFDPEAVQQGLAIGVGGCGYIELGGRHDPNFGGSPTTLYGRVVHVSHGRFQAWGPVCGGVWQNMGLSLCFRVCAADFDRPDLAGVGIGVRDTDSYDPIISTDTRYIDVCITSCKQQAYDRAQLIDLGVDPAALSRAGPSTGAGAAPGCAGSGAGIMVLKSMNHFRADFGPLAKQIAFVDGGGLGCAIMGGGGGGGGGGGAGYKNVRRPIWPLDPIEGKGEGGGGGGGGVKQDHHALRI